MRNLHPVAAHETFVASGTYRYYRDGVLMPVTEHFTMHSLAEAARLVRVDEDGRDEDGLTILSEALYNPAGKLERFNVQSYNSKDAQTPTFKADYTFFEDYVQIGRKVGDAAREYEEFEFVVACVPYLKQTVYMGYTIRDILARENKSQVYAPRLLSTSESVLQKIIVDERDTSDIQVGNKTINATKYQIADDVFYWLDIHWIPVRREYTYNGVPYVVTLTNYAHA
jgi:hypothetical protein